MIGSKRKKTNTVAPAKVEEAEYTSERFLKGFEGMSTKEIKAVIYLVDDGFKFDEAVKKVREKRSA